MKNTKNKLANAGLEFINTSQVVSVSEVPESQKDDTPPSIELLAQPNTAQFLKAIKEYADRGAVEKLRVAAALVAGQSGNQNYVDMNPEKYPDSWVQAVRNNPKVATEFNHWGGCFLKQRPSTGEFSGDIHSNRSHRYTLEDLVLSNWRSEDFNKKLNGDDVIPGRHAQLTDFSNQLHALEKMSIPECTEGSELREEVNNICLILGGQSPDEAYYASRGQRSPQELYSWMHGNQGWSGMFFDAIKGMDEAVGATLPKTASEVEAWIPDNWVQKGLFKLNLTTSLAQKCQDDPLTAKLVYQVGFDGLDTAILGSLKVWEPHFKTLLLSSLSNRQQVEIPVDESNVRRLNLMAKGRDLMEDPRFPKELQKQTVCQWAIAYELAVSYTHLTNWLTSNAPQVVEKRSQILNETLKFESERESGSEKKEDMLRTFVRLGGSDVKALALASLRQDDSILNKTIKLGNLSVPSVYNQYDRYTDWRKGFSKWQWLFDPQVQEHALMKTLMEDYQKTETVKSTKSIEGIARGPLKYSGQILLSLCGSPKEAPVPQARKVMDTLNKVERIIEVIEKFSIEEVIDSLRRNAAINKMHEQRHHEGPRESAEAIELTEKYKTILKKVITQGLDIIHANPGVSITDLESAVKVSSDQQFAHELRHFDEPQKWFTGFLDLQEKLKEEKSQSTVQLSPAAAKKLGSVGGLVRSSQRLFGIEAQDAYGLVGETKKLLQSEGLSNAGWKMLNASPQISTQLARYMDSVLASQKRQVNNEKKKAKASGVNLLTDESEVIAKFRTSRIEDKNDHDRLPVKMMNIALSQAAERSLGSADVEYFIGCCLDERGEVHKSIKSVLLGGDVLDMYSSYRALADVAGQTQKGQDFLSDIRKNFVDESAAHEKLREKLIGDALKLCLGWRSKEMRPGYKLMEYCRQIDDAARKMPDFYQSLDPKAPLSSANRLQERWHEDQQEKGFNEAHSHKKWDPVFGIIHREKSEVSNAGAPFVAIEMCEAKLLWEEGKEQHHCVYSYVDRAMEGQSVLFSVRQSRTRVATLEFKPQDKNGNTLAFGGENVGLSDAKKIDSWALVQCKGMCNGTVRDPDLLAFCQKEMPNVLMHKTAEWIKNKEQELERKRLAKLAGKIQ